jgi:glycerol-3-phosphate acyltransferase PlsY
MSGIVIAGVLIGAYALGSINWSYVIVRLFMGRDIRTLGSGNAGATNVLRTAGKGAGAAALVLDLGKGIIAVLGARALGAPPLVVAGAAVAVVLGHIYPVFFGFRGGKGVASAAGALGALAPLAFLGGLLVFAGVVAWRRYVSLGSVLAAVCIPVFIAIQLNLGGVVREGSWAIGAAACIAVLIVVRHRANLQRLRAGTEHRLGEKRAVALGEPPVGASGR